MSLRISPVVDMKTTTSKVARLASVNWAASSVATTVKPLAVPSAWIAAMPCGIESWRKPPVLENTSTRSSVGASTVIEPVMPVCSVHRNVYVPAVLNVRWIGAPFGPRDSLIDQFELVDVTLCVVAAASNSQRTVSPVSIVTLAGWKTDEGESTESMTTVSAIAGAAPMAQAKSGCEYGTCGPQRTHMRTALLR